MKRSLLVASILLLVGASITAAVAGSGSSKPERLPLPDGFQPEGIAIRGGNDFFVGSIPTGAIFRGDLQGGEGSILVEAQEGRSAVGLALGGHDMLFVAGGKTGQGYVYDSDTGDELGVFQLTESTTFINDVVATNRAAWFTDSVNPFLYRLPIDGDGELGTEAEAVPLTGDIAFQEGFNVNGIDATSNGKTLVIVQSNTGKLFTVDPDTGVTTEIDLGDENVANGDGILLDGSRLFVVQNSQNLVAVLELESDLTSGEVVDRISDDDFDIPTTVAEKGNGLFLVNARFSTPPAEDTEYWVARIRKP